MIKRSVLFSVFNVLNFSILAQCTDLFISEYVEGSFNNHAIELYNPTSEIVDLSNYSLSRWSNGATTPLNTILSGYIQPMSTYVIGKDKRDPNGEGYEAPLWNGWYVFVDSTTQLLDSIYTEEEDLMSRVDLFINPNYEDGTMYFNGNDAITLETASGDILDIIGKIGEDPGDGWGPVENGWPWTQNHTLIRKSDVTSGFVSNPAQSFSFDPTLEWDSLPQNTFINLGTHSCDCSNIIETFGCTQETAFNYNSDANIDDGSCIWIDPTMDCGPSIQEVYFPLYLPQGWGMFGFTCTNSIDLFDAFQSIVDQVLIVKDAVGAAYLPEYGYNGIGDLIYSRGYQIKTTEEILDFSFCTTLIVSEGP
jgi:hypothetical protein